ncbi:MAG: protein kinase [Actinobacteria bacterium]|uniref:Unannotated protein n=1 Tax=freshwater metagenome TaxID=449393 RepID=A0A6J6SG36_9ZZZZ|nr:protein kinase [Actinomycetota bacterium]
MTDDRSRVVGGRYELRGLLGSGGMAEVHRALDPVLQREVAVKVMRTALVDPVDRQRFASETRVLAGLSSRHLVTLLDAGVDEPETPGAPPRPWLVMELVDGPTLAQRLAIGDLSQAEVARIGAGVAAGLDHVHRAGVVHRDVKPANVLLTATGVAKLADFGVARRSGEDAQLTRTGHTVGTAAYLAPEQLSDEPVTGASDVYSLGLVLLEALTGRRAYVGTGTEVAFARLRHSPTIPVSLGARWTRLLAAMVAELPTDRPSAGEVAAALTSLGLAEPAPLSSRDDPSLEATGSWTALPLAATPAPARAGDRSRRRVLAAVAAVAVASGLTGALVSAGSGGQVPPAAASAAVGSPASDAASSGSVRPAGSDAASASAAAATSDPAPVVVREDRSTRVAAAPPQRPQADSGAPHAKEPRKHPKKHPAKGVGHRGPRR